jgi:hypothetical protein
MSLCLQQALNCGLLGSDVLTRSSIQCRAAQKLQVIFIGLRSSCSVIGRTVVGLRSSCSAIGRTVVIGLVPNWPVMGWTVVGRGWIDTGGIRGEAAAEAAAEAVAAMGWFIGCGRSTKGR